MNSLFSVTQPCLDLGLLAGGIRFDNISTKNFDSGRILDLVAEEASSLREEFESSKDIRAIPEIRCLRGIFEKLQISSRKNVPAIQRLMEMAHKRGCLPTISPLVDAYNYLSLKTRCCLGAHDLELFEHPSRLDILDGTESFIPLGSQNQEAVRAGEFGYIDANDRVMCRLDVMQGDFSKVGPDTSSILLIVETTAYHDASSAERIFEMCESLLCDLFDATAERVFFPFNRVTKNS